MRVKLFTILGSYDLFVCCFHSSLKHWVIQQHLSNIRRKKWNWNSVRISSKFSKCVPRETLVQLIVYVIIICMRNSEKQLWR